jgi:broad specificity phosphatase PhoE
VATLFYITHPNVEVEPDVAVARWSLSDTGRRRAATMAEQVWVRSVRRVLTSDETKAVETAEILAAALSIEPEVVPGTGEMDRTATGYLPAVEFEALADAFFAAPDVSVSGWERAVDAQRRIAGALDPILDEPTQRGDVAVVGHGGVGTLWYCHLAGISIDRAWDQPGQGHVFAVDTATRRPRHHWRPIESADVGDA